MAVMAIDLVMAGNTDTTTTLAGLTVPAVLVVYEMEAVEVYQV